MWKAYDRDRKELVAVKVLHGDKARDRSHVERFFRGAKKMAELTHPAIVRVVQDHGEDGSFQFFVMEYLEGGDLRSAVREKRVAGEENIVRIIREIGAGLEYAHQAGLVHRDVKPANIILDLGGRAKLTDFDLVRAGDTTGGTRTGMLGTFLYAAPECLEQAKEAGPPADIYSLGMTAVFALYGAELPVVAFRRPEEFVGRLNCGDMLKRVLLRAIEEEPRKRFSSCEYFCEALLEIMVTTEYVSPRKRLVNREDRRRFLDIMRGTGHCAAERALAGKELDRLGDPRFEKNPWGLPGEEMLGFVKIPAGRFLMGSRKGEADAFAGEVPQHEVELADYYIGRYPVTVEQFGAYCRARGMDPGHADALKGALRPYATSTSASGWRCPHNSEP